MNIKGMPWTALFATTQEVPRPPKPVARAPQFRKEKRRYPVAAGRRSSARICPLE